MMNKLVQSSFSFVPGKFVYPRRLASVTPSRTVRWVSNETFTPLSVSVTENKRLNQVCNAKKIEEDGDSQILEKLEREFVEAWKWLIQARQWLEKLKLPATNSSKEFYKEFQSMLDMEIGCMEMILQSYAGLRGYEKKLSGGEENIQILLKTVTVYESMVRIAEGFKAAVETQSDLDLALLEAATEWETEVRAKLIEARRNLSGRKIPSDLDKVHRRAVMLTVWLDDASKRRALIQSNENHDDDDLKVATDWEMYVMQQLAKCRRDLRAMEDKMIPLSASEDSN